MKSLMILVYSRHSVRACCYGNRFVVIDAMLLLMPLAMLLSMPVVMPVVFPLALDSVSCMRKECPLISAPAIERDRSSVVMFTARVAVVNGVVDGVANCVVNRVDGASIMISVFSKVGFSCFCRRRRMMVPGDFVNKVP